MKETVFFLEDDKMINALIKATLETSGFDAVGFTDPLVFLEQLKTRQPDLLVLDLMLPHISGYDVLKIMRENEKYANIPVIILSALSDELDVVRGLDNGAVDYISKPFGVLEFISRIKSNLRKNKPVVRRGTVSVRDLTVDRDKHVCTLCGGTVQLTAKEFELVSVLAENVNTVVTREEILREIWGYETDIATRTLDMHVKTVREKFSKLTSAPYIVTVRAVGYVIYDKE